MDVDYFTNAWAEGRQKLLSESMYYRGYQRFSASEMCQQIKRVGPLDALRAEYSMMDACRAANASGLPGSINGPQDAWRHTYWSCDLARVIGVDQAAKVLELHEEIEPGGSKYYSDMDSLNNQVGLGLCGGTLDPGRVATAALEGGALYIIPNYQNLATEAPQPPEHYLPDSGE